MRVTFITIFIISLLYDFKMRKITLHHNVLLFAVDCQSLQETLNCKITNSVFSLKGNVK